MNNSSRPLLLAVLLLVLSCSDDEEPGIALPESTISYFKAIALGFENGGSTEITRKWRTTMKVFLDGDPSTELIAKVDQTIAEINDLATDGFSVEKVDSLSESNCYMFFGTAAEFNEQFPDAEIGTNFGLFNVWWFNNVINRARIFVDTSRPTLDQQRSLVIEELTQVLGLGKDSPRFPGSVFYETASNGGFATEYLDIDKELIRLLYHPDMPIGLDEDQVDVVLRRILTDESEAGS